MRWGAVPCRWPNMAVELLALGVTHHLSEGEASCRIVGSGGLWEPQSRDMGRGPYQLDAEQPL